MYPFPWLRACAASLALSLAAHAGEFRLAAHDSALCTIVVAGSAADESRADDPERHAALELARYLGETCGAKFAVVSASKALAGPRILVGREAARGVFTKAELDSLGAEGYWIRARGSDLAITGGAPRGTLYGVYSFLEDRLGCRWFTPDVARIPRSTSGSVDASEAHYVPPLEYRATDYPNSRDADWAVRNKLNGTQTQLDAARGGKIDYSHFVHTFYEIVPPASYFAAHPDYFAEVDSRRLDHDAQLCVSNPAVLELATKTVREWMRAAPKASIFSVSQNDCFNPCACAACKKIYDEEGGAWSGPLLRFVDSIAGALKQEFPDRAIDTLAYQYTRKPPTLTKPLENVIVRLCSIECCFAHPLTSPETLDPANAAFARDLAAWGRLSRRLYIWDYVIDYSHTIMPFPNLRSIAPNIRFFVANGVKGVYEEADYFTPGGELAYLRTWLIAKTLWNPNYDTERAIDEFLDGYYGAAAKPLGEYVRLLHDRANRESIHFNIWAGPDSPLFDGATLAKCDELFEVAENSLRAEPNVLARVETARLPLVYVELNHAADRAQKSGDKRELRSILARFDAYATKSGVTMINESTPYSAWLASAKKLAE